MSEARPTLGLAIYHRERLGEVLAQATGPLLALLGGAASSMSVFLGDERIGPCEAKTLSGITLRDLTLGRDRGLIVADDLEAPTIYIELYHPQHQQRRGLAPSMVGALLPTSKLDLNQILAFADSLDARYGFACAMASFEAAWDEVFWPSGPALRSPQGQRRHPDAWIQLMRAFGRPEVGNGIPDVYWLNLFGGNLINTLRKMDCWDRLEAHVGLRYLERGAVAFTLSNDLNDIDPARARIVGDIVAPLGLMQRALEQARQGDQLLLNALVATGDQRLLHGLAFKNGLEAFKELVGGPTGEIIETLEEARSWLKETAGERPRCYGEPWPEGGTTRPEVNAPPPAPPAPAGPPAPAPPAKAPAPPAPLPVAQEDEDPNSAETAAAHLPSWTIRTISRGTVRIELATVQWVADAGVHTDRLEVGLLNSSPRPIEVTAVRALKLSGRAPSGLYQRPLDALLEAAGGRASATVDLPPPTPGDTLQVHANLRYALREPLADLVVEPQGVRALTDDAEMSAWPADARLGITGSTITVCITNTTQEPWRIWGLSLTSSGAQVPLDQAEGFGVLDPGANHFLQLSLPRDHQGTVQVWLDAQVEVSTVLAVFVARERG